MINKSWTSGRSQNLSSRSFISSVIRLLCDRTYYVQGYKTKAQVLTPDVAAGDSVIHIINKVLVPKLGP